MTSSWHLRCMIRDCKPLQSFIRRCFCHLIQRIICMSTCERVRMRVNLYSHFLLLLSVIFHQIFFICYFYILF